MKVSNVLILLGAVFMGLFVVPRWIFVRPQLNAEQDYFVTPERTEQIRHYLAEELSKDTRACIFEGPFPFDPHEQHGGCGRCEDLERAGLIKKSVTEYEEYGETKFAAQFDLTELGETVYSDTKIPGQAGGPRFCFATFALDHVESVRYVKYFNDPGTPGFIARYVAEMKDPSPLLYGPSIAALKLPLPPLPERGERVLFPEGAQLALYRGRIDRHD